MAQLALGLDFGTESVRALMVEVQSGREVGEGIVAYKNGVMDRELTATSGAPLPKDFALQDANDYLDAMGVAVRTALAQMQAQGVTGSVIGIGVDFTASTPMPVRQGKPLSAFLPNDPHAYVKLWKHHAAQVHADFINQNAPKDLLARYGGAVSSEWSLPKLLEVEAQSPQAFEMMEQWIEGGDWIVSTLIGRAERPVRSRCQAGYKGLWSEQHGYPAPEFLNRCSTQVAQRFEQLMAGTPQPLAAAAGTITEAWADRLGLGSMAHDAVVAIAAIDAHAGVPGSGVSRDGAILCVLGTSTCHMALSKELKYIPGVAGAVPDGIIPGLVGYEAGQPAVGDLFSWFLRMQGRKTSPEEFARLETEAEKVPAGANGVTALDWWNGNRSVLMDSTVKGTWVGMSLTTTDADLYRALIESTAFGTKVIVDTMADGGVRLDKVVLTGGIAAKSPLLCQIYADVLNTEVEIVHARQPVALGGAIYGAAAALKKSSEDSFATLVEQMTAQVKKTTIKPKQPEAYVAPFERYRELSKVMHKFYHHES